MAVPKRRRAPRPQRTRGARRVPGWLRAAGWLTVLLGALFLVVDRQTRAVAMERELRALENERAVAEAERVELIRWIESLRSRARVVRVARERLGMHLPGDDEIVFLPVAVDADEGADVDADAGRSR